MNETQRHIKEGNEEAEQQEEKKGKDEGEERTRKGMRLCIGGRV